jgi:hypothetical protein
MSMTFHYPNIPRPMAEKILAEIKERLKFAQKVERSVNGYFFDFENSQKIVPVMTQMDSNIYPYAYRMSEIEGGNNISFTIYGPYYAMREMKIEKMKDFFEKNNPGKTFEVPKPPNLDPMRKALEFTGSLRNYQMVDCPKIIQRMDLTGSCLFIADPGYGKTVVMCYVASYYKVKTLVVVPTVGLSMQTMKELKSRFPTAKAIAYENNCDIDDDVDIVVTYAPRIEGNIALFKRFELVVLDEIHMLSSPYALAGLLSTTPKRILGLTATPGTKNAISEMIVGPKTFNSCLVKRWSISFPKIYSGLNGTDYVNLSGYASALTDLAKCEKYISQVVAMIKFFLKCGERVIAITMRTDLNDSLSFALQADQIDCQVLDPKSKQARNCDVIIGTHKMIGTGFDLSNYVDDFDGKGAGVVFFLGSIKDDTLMYQICGRSFRSKFSHAVFPIVADIKTFVNHGERLIRTCKTLEGCRHKEGFSKFLESLVAGNYS